MRATLDIDDEVLAAVREVAKCECLTAGQVVSRYMRPLQFCEGRGKQLMRKAMVRNHIVATCSEMYNKSIIESLISLLGEPVYSTADRAL
jgi:hypothetical protein